jgi:hypothetical protein
MKNIVATALFMAVFPSRGDAYSVPLKLSEIFGCSDLIVEGVIADVGDSTFTVDCVSVMAGACTDSRVTVRKFRDWTCAQRRIPYEKGQRLLLFLDVDRNSHDLYRVRGSGDEGEMLFHGGEFLWRGTPVERYPATMQELHGKKVGGSLLPREEVLRSLAAFRECFECSREIPIAFSRELPRVRWWATSEIELKCDPSKVADLRSSSDVGHHLVREVQESPAYMGPPQLE